MFARTNNISNAKPASSTIGSGPGRRAELLGALPLHEILTLLTPEETCFFEMLDAELDKVEVFYLAREDEMIERGRLLQMQLNELNDHGNLVLVRHFYNSDKAGANFALV